jgi:hypothetical protein
LTVTVSPAAADPRPASIVGRGVASLPSTACVGGACRAVTSGIFVPVSMSFTS